MQLQRPRSQSGFIVERAASTGSQGKKHSHGASPGVAAAWAAVDSHKGIPLLPHLDKTGARAAINNHGPPPQGRGAHDDRHEANRQALRPRRLPAADAVALRLRRGRLLRPRRDALSLWRRRPELRVARGVGARRPLDADGPRPAAPGPAAESSKARRRPAARRDHGGCAEGRTRGDARRARARDCAGGLPDICTSWPAVVRADVLRGAAEHVVRDVVRGPVAAPDEVATKANASHVAVGLPDGQRREPGRQRRPPRHGPPHHDRRPGGPDIYPRVGRAGVDGRVPALARGRRRRRRSDARGGPSAPAGGRAAGSPGREATRAFTPHRRQGGHWEEGAPVQPLPAHPLRRDAAPGPGITRRRAGLVPHAARRAVAGRSAGVRGLAPAGPDAGLVLALVRVVSHPRQGRYCFECSNRRTDGFRRSVVR